MEARTSETDAVIASESRRFSVVIAIVALLVVSFVEVHTRLGMHGLLEAVGVFVAVVGIGGIPYYLRSLVIAGRTPGHVTFLFAIGAVAAYGYFLWHGITSGTFENGVLNLAIAMTNCFAFGAQQHDF